ncbi:MAG: FKBP-type peptidyl-prolyl cis-trans isomerase [Bacteroidales bacterium]|nr:FKBP-type peptidyl-prolyl cis-trans isomerase [Bacteroidales bacterium]
MNRIHKLAAVATLLLLMVSCKNDSVYSGYDKMENGAYMKFFERHVEGDMPRVGDAVTIEMVQYFNDTMLFTTVGDKPLELKVQTSDFVGDVPDALRMMHVGDSARLVVLSDSVFVKLMGVDVPKEYLGEPIYYDLKLLSIKPLEVIEAERRARLDSLRLLENDYLVGLQANPKNIVTGSGLIVMETTGKGKCAKLGDYVNLDFLMCTVDGDTVMNSFDVESLDMQYGEEFICKGFNEAMGMVPEGGMMRFVIPSELGFDSTGFDKYIKPYAALVVKMRMNNVMDQAEHDAKQAKLEAEQEAEKQRLLLEESQLIDEYVKDNGITVEPTESGLYIIPVEKGEGNMAKSGDKVSVHYTLNNLKGELVESSYDYGEPMSFIIGQGEMIPAIEEALLKMAPGAKVKLLSPSSQAFGEVEIDKALLPPYSPLLIELELVSIEP